MAYLPQGPGSGGAHLSVGYPVAGLILCLALVGGTVYGFNPTASEINSTKAAITFTFDDGYYSTLNQAYPILNKYGYTGTAFVVTDLIGKPGHMSVTDLWALENKGWEIGSQTVTNRDLTTLNDTELDNEISGSRAFLERNFIHVWGIASPYGNYNQRVINNISSQYLYHRTSWPDALNDIPLKNQSCVYEVRAVHVTSKTTVQEVKDWMLKAKKEGKWIVLIFHDIGGQDENSWSAANLNEVAKFAKDNNFQGMWTERSVLSTMMLYKK
jgi:peptidoglycan/xylan/chitin deacetylase (PgdA/CDA1 family)